MLENDPTHDGSPVGDAEADDFEAFYLYVEEGDLEDGGDEELGEQESVLARLDRAADPSSISLETIPPRLWEQTLAPLPRQQRMWTALRVPDKELKRLAIELASELDMAEGDAALARRRATHAALRTGYPLPSPDPGPGAASAPAPVQVNIRLRRDDHARLAQAAETVGLKPTTLARSLVLNGAAMILREHGKEHLAPPARPDYTPLRLD
jgi:hypothetical protein